MSHLLETLSDALADAVGVARPGLVRVEARKRFGASGVVWSSDGLVVTNHHVVQRETNIRVTLDDERMVPATLLGRDPGTDLALLRIDANGLPTMPRAEIEKLRVGHLVLGMGRPGRTARATLGIVSALGGSWRTPSGGALDRYVQSDLTLYPGFSGGALVDASGALLGVTTSALMRGTALAIPLETVARVATDLLEHGRIKRGYLGVSTYPVRLSAKTASAAGQEDGLLLVTIDPESPADRAGLLVGDILVSLSGHRVGDLESLLSYLSEERSGSTATARIVRGGAVMELDVVIGERG